MSLKLHFPISSQQDPETPLHKGQQLISKPEKTIHPFLKNPYETLNELLLCYYEFNQHVIYVHFRSSVY